MKSRYFLFTSAVLLTSVLSVKASYAQGNEATCKFDSGYAMNISTLALAPVINIRAGMPVKTLLWDSGWLNGGSTAITCGLAGDSSKTFSVQGGYMNNMTLSAVGDSIYDTGIPGIGVKVFYSNSHEVSSDRVLEYPRKSQSVMIQGDQKQYSPASEYKIQFWSTGNYASGSTVFPNPLASTQYGDLVTNQVSLSNTRFVVNLVGCTVQSSVNVDLGNVNDTTFTGVGSASAWNHFKIPLNCYAGTKISTTIDATQDPANVAGVIQLLTQDNSATGLGVQLSYAEGAAVVFGEKSLFKESSSTTENIELATRMYQTHEKVTMGKVSAVAYLTMTYE